ncbi:hypothetical protein, partial [Escherichia coli]|uniref:hypothetical protein n=1 Tax=Escherichia coli TaxID=562 RepID=UPI0019D5FFEB
IYHFGRFYVSFHGLSSPKHKAEEHGVAILASTVLLKVAELNPRVVLEQFIAVQKLLEERLRH